MKKISILFATLAVLVACVVMSCGGSSSSGGDEPNNGGVTVKFLTEDEFAKSSWKGEMNGKELTLDVTSKTSMTLKYYEVVSVAKNTDPQYNLVTVVITYAFDAEKGVASGSANNVVYTATLTAKDKLDFTMGSYGVVKLTKK